MYLMGVDIGTSSAKAIVMTTSGEMIAEAQHSYSISEPQPGYRVQDAGEVLEAVLKTMCKAITQIPDVQKLSGICFSCAMHSLLAVDQHGKPLTPILLWADTRSIKQSEFIKQSPLAKELYEQCGVPIHPMTPLCKIMWLKENEPELFDKTYKFISIKEYLFYHLTGQYVIDHSIASATGMFNIHSLEWHEKALNLAGINETKLSTPVSILQQYALLPSLQQRLGLPDNVPLVIGSSDGCLANIGSGVTENGDIAVTISTSMAVRITSSAPFNDDAHSLFNYAITPGKYICGGGSNSGSLLLSWMADSVLQNKLYSDPEAFMQKAMTAPAGCEGLIFLPYMLGERAPVWDANATGVITGFRLHHQQQHIMRALIEGLTMNVYTIIERLMKVPGKINTIKASGGFTKSKEWLQMLADVSGLNVSIDNTADASAIGAFIVGGYSLGIFSSFVPPFKHQQGKVTYTPQADEHAVYQKNYEVFRRLYSNNQKQRLEIS